MSKFERNAGRLTIFLLIALTIEAVAGVIWLPDRIPVHYNFRGEVDRYGSPATLLILPGIGLFIAFIMRLPRRMPVEMMNFPGPRTPENIARQVENGTLLLASLRPLIISMFLVIQTQSIWKVASGQTLLIRWLLPALIVSMFLVIGFFLRRAYRLVPRQ
ncbi:DUF1648 domain-containing protein [Spirosoma pomorum]